MARLAVVTTLAAALERLEARGARPLAGGVGVMLARARGAAAGGDFVAVGHLPDLVYLRAMGDGSTAIGAATTLEALVDADDDLVPPLLRAAAADAANPGIRAIGTLGGNVVDTGAASDLVAALIALGAEVRIVRRDGSRQIALADLWSAEGHEASSGSTAALGSVALRPDELIESLTIPAPAAVGWGWERLTLHGAMDRSAASLGIAIFPAGEARVALTAAVTRPMRLRAVEDVVGSTDPPVSAHAMSALSNRIRLAARADLADAPILADDRAPAAYRREVVPVLAERAVMAALARVRAVADA